MQDEELVKEVNKIMNGEIRENFSISQDGVLTIKGRICVPNVEDLKKLIMEEAHCLANLCIRVVPRCIKLSRRIMLGPLRLC